MLDGKQDHFFGKKKLSSLSDEKHASVISNGASFTPLDGMRGDATQGAGGKAFLKRPGDLQLKSVDVTDNSIIGISRHSAESGAVTGTTVTNITVSGSAGDILSLERPYRPYLDVAAGGVVDGLIVESYGTAFADNGGIIKGATASNEGVAFASNNGIIDGGTALAGGTLFVSSGGTLIAGDANHNVVSGTATNGGTLIAQDGGTVVNGLIAGSGSERVQIGISVPLERGAAAYGTVGNQGVFSNLTVGGGGRLEVDAGGTVDGLQAAGFANSLTILGQGLYSGASVLINVEGGGTVNGGTVGIYGTITETGKGAAVNNLTLGGTYDPTLNIPLVKSVWGGYYGGTLLLNAPGATASNLQVLGGALADAAASGATILGGTAFGTQGPLGGHTAGGVIAAEAAGAVVSGATAGVGGIIVAGVSGATAGGIIQSGGTLTVGANGGLADLVPSTDGSGAVISNATLFSGATLYSSGNAGLFGTYGGGSGLVAGASYNSITFMSGQILGMQQGSMSHATVSEGAAVGAFGSGVYVDGGTVYGGAAGAASLDALNGGTIFNGTAGSGGVIGVGGLGKVQGNPFALSGQGRSLLQGGKVEDGGLLVAGGNSNLTVTKNGTKVTFDGKGLVEDALIDAGGIADINKQGTFIGGTVGGYALVENGGTMSGALFSGAADGGMDGANGYVDIGGTVTANTVMSGAVLSVAGGTAWYNTAMAGGTIEIGQGYSRYVEQGSNGALAVSSGSVLYHGTSIAGTVENGGVQVVNNGGTDSYTTVMQGGTMVVKSGGYAFGATIGAGQDKWIGPPGEGTLTDNLGSEDGAYISNGGIFSSGTLADGTGSGSTVGEMGGLIRVERGATVADLHMGDFGQIEVMGVQYGAGESVTYANGTITLMSDGHGLWSGTLDGSSYNPSSFQVWDDGGTAVIVYDQCFLHGTLISTPRGDIEIQHLKAGDTVWAIVNGKKIERKITTTRSKRNRINKELPTDLAGWSVCIKAGAFGENLPKRDLRVTPEHSFLFYNRLVPVRMLINGRTIYYDTSLEHFEFYHIETEPHSIIRAEGVLTESWLNTEERREAVNLSNNITRLDRIPPRTWEKDAAASLDVSVGFVEPLWRKFAERAAFQKISLKDQANKSFSRDPLLRLCLEDGREIEPLNKRGNQYFFQIPPGFKGGYLVSKNFRPSESIGPWIDDRRQLGVLVGKMIVAIGSEFHSVTVHHLVANLQGWDVIENSPCRWTKGKAEIPSLGSEEALQFGASLIIEILAGGPYPEQTLPAQYNYYVEKEV